LAPRGPGEGVGTDLDIGEACGRESVGKGVGIDGVVDVVVVKGGELVAGNAVGGHELASGAQYPSHLGEQAILQFSRWHVMEHGQRHRAGEATVIEGHLGGVGVHDLDVGSGEARCERGRQFVVELDRGEARSLVRRETAR
jgi:hypothetical protein